jgi:diguanylate cyclase (GGDEF)-like protein
MLEIETEARSPPPPISLALLESRQRWRDLATMAADIAFETDASQRFAFIHPEVVLGWPAATLLGQPAEILIARADGEPGANPFRVAAPVRRRRAWLRRADGTCVCLAFSVAPLFDAAGNIVGSRGIGQDMTAQDRHDAALAAALRRGEVVDHILWRMRQEVMAPRMMQAALHSLVTAVGAAGCAVVDMIGDGVEPHVLHAFGADFGRVRHVALTLLESGSRQPLQARAPEGELVLACPSDDGIGAQAGIVLWRAPAGRAWDADEMTLASSAIGIVRVILDHEAIQREMARQARTDPLTLLLNRRAFLDEIARHIERLDREELPGTLIFVDLDHFKALNDEAGHDAGDAALVAAAQLLRETVRPADLVARLGGDEFALWLDGADSLTAAERAEALRLAVPALTPASATRHLGVSIGIATRWPNRDESIDSLMHRADQAMYAAKRAGRGRWRVAADEDAPGNGPAAGAHHP